MKYINYIALFLSVVLFCSCEGMNDIHSDYIKDGEIIYAAKADSVSFIAGKNRIMMRCWAENTPNIKNIVLFWNSRKDSVEIPVSLNVAKDSVDYILEDMAEQSYTFDVKFVDDWGNSSLFMTGFGTSYGSNYEKTLSNRMVKTVGSEGLDTRIDWYPAQKGVVAMEVEYTNKSSELTTESVVSDSTYIVLPIKVGSTFRTRTLFEPEVNSLDQFATEWIESEPVEGPVQSQDYTMENALEAKQMVDARNENIYSVGVYNGLAWIREDLYIGESVDRVATDDGSLADGSYWKFDEEGIQNIANPNSNDNPKYGVFFDFWEAVSGGNILTGVPTDASANTMQIFNLADYNAKVVTVGANTFVQGVCPDGWHMPSLGEFDASFGTNGYPADFMIYRGGEYHSEGKYLWWFDDGALWWTVEANMNGATRITRRNTNGSGSYWGGDDVPSAGRSVRCILNY